MGGDYAQHFFVQTSKRLDEKAGSLALSVENPHFADSFGENIELISDVIISVAGMSS